MSHGLEKSKSLVFYNVAFLYFIKNNIISVLWINAYSWSWFEAKDLCQSNGTVIGTTSNSSDNFWTKYYQRRSHWISTLGNHH